MSTFTLMLRRYFSNSGAEIVNFSERTLSWIVSSAHSHMQSNVKYPFQEEDIKLLNPSSYEDLKTLIPCTKQVTSQWFIKKMMNNKSHIHSFSDISTNSNVIKNTFKLSPNSLESDSILHDEKNKIQIEKLNINELSSEWIHRHGYSEYFDVIFDELALDKMMKMDCVSTTICGHTLKPTGIIYVMHKKLSGDITGSKLRQKIGSLYPNTHFELISERVTPWTTQFVFLKIYSCSHANSDRDANRIDHAANTHYNYNQDSIHGPSKVLKHAGRDMKAGMERVFDAFGIKEDTDEKYPRF